MRTIAKLRLPAYVFIAIVLRTALPGRLWVMAVLAVVFGSIAAYKSATDAYIEIYEPPNHPAGLRNDSAAVLRDVQGGQTVVVTRKGTPIAKLSALFSTVRAACRDRQRLRPGFSRGLRRSALRLGRRREPAHR
jgi:antitoxin (DNA-binding transcriptional repressor) of toxin-antitoxin stability system